MNLLRHLLARFREAMTRPPFDAFAICRRWSRRKWERWWVDSPVNGDCWHDVDEWSHVTGKRPTGLCRGTPLCEDWSDGSGRRFMPGRGAP